MILDFAAYTLLEFIVSTAFFIQKPVPSYEAQMLWTRLLFCVNGLLNMVA